MTVGAACGETIPNAFGPPPPRKRSWRRCVKTALKRVARAVRPRACISGPIVRQVDRRLWRFDFYREFRSGKLSRQDFCAELLARRDAVRSCGVPDTILRFVGRFPADERGFVAGILHDLVAGGVIRSAEYDEPAFAAYRRQVESCSLHGEYATWICPEEERLVYAVMQNVRPRSLIVLDSFFGYWALWALPAVRDAGGTAYLLDPDPDACAVAARNVRRMGFAGTAQVWPANAVEFMSSRLDRYDAALLDADGPAEHPDPDWRGKRIYFPLVREFCRHRTSDAVLVCHNVLRRGPAPDPLIEQDRAAYERDYARFLPYVTENFSRCAEYETTQGVGIYRT